MKEKSYLLCNLYLSHQNAQQLRDIVLLIGSSCLQLIVSLLL